MRLGRAVPWGIGVLALGLTAVLAALILAPPPPSPHGPEPGRSLFRAHCAGCHGTDGRGRTWRARVLFLRPGDLTRSEMSALPDAYFVELMRQGGAIYGKPGMPSFRVTLTDAEIVDLVRYLRVLPRAPRDVGGLRPERRRSVARGGHRPVAPFRHARAEGLETGRPSLWGDERLTTLPPAPA